MLEKAKSLKNYTLRSIDGDIGKVEEFYFDDKHWTIRYLVADLGDWLSEREVLVSPYSLGEVNSEERFIAVDLTKKQIEHSPSLGSHKPVSRQYEESYFQYYGWPTYWEGPYSWGMYPYITRNHEKLINTGQPKKQWDSHLRSSRDMTGHHIQAKDGVIGHVDDFIVDDETWAVRYLVVDTKDWWPGKKVLISARWITRVDWIESKVYLDLTRAAVKKSPEYTETSLLSRSYEAGLHQHYDRTAYWVDEMSAQEDYLAASSAKGE
jgi:uncharacterized protein YrrD